MPIASDLFFIYTQVNDIQSYISSVTSEERLRGQSSSILNAATTVLRAGTELLPIGQTLQYAVADRIDAQEADCRDGPPRPESR